MYRLEHDRVSVVAHHPQPVEEILQRVTGDFLTLDLEDDLVRSEPAAVVVHPILVDVGDPAEASAVGAATDDDM